MVHKPFISFTGLIRRQKRARYQAQRARVIFHEYSYASSIRCELCKVTFMVHVLEVSGSYTAREDVHSLQVIYSLFLKLNQSCLKKSTCICRKCLQRTGYLNDFYAPLVDKWPKQLTNADWTAGLFLFFLNTNKGKKIKPSQTAAQQRKEKKKTTKKFLVSQEKRNLQGHTTEVAPSKGFLSPVSMGRTPAEQLQRQAMAPHERFCLEAGRRTT